MKPSITQRYPLLEQVSLELLQEIEYSEITLEAHAKTQENGDQTIELVLVDDIIMLYSHKKSQSEPLAYVRLSFCLKFQSIFQTKNFFERQLKGFKLVNDINQSISFYITFVDISSLWCIHLSKFLNQTSFHNCYKPIRTLGKGSSATVYEIAHLDDGSRFASKVFSKQNFQNNKLKMKSFLNQLQVMRSISHKNLLKLESIFQSQNSFYVIMERLNGGNLHQYLIKRRIALGINEIKGMMRCILEGLVELQQTGIVHRDIKLQNLMIRDKSLMEIVIVDFGLAVFHEDDDYSYYQCGTPGYIPPQFFILKKGQKLTPKCDVFSAGVVLHILLTGRYLFQGSNMQQMLESNRKMRFDLQKQEYQRFDPSLLELMKRMVERDPSKRPFASECLKHTSLIMNEGVNSNFSISPAPTNQDYHF